jgi:hypothetical protein
MMQTAPIKDVFPQGMIEFHSRLDVAFHSVAPSVMVALQDPEPVQLQWQLVSSRLLEQMTAQRALEPDNNAPHQFLVPGVTFEVPQLGGVTTHRSFHANFLNGEQL